MKSRPAPYEDIALSLALSLIAASVTPVLLLDGDLVIVAASQTFCEAFAVDPEEIPGRRLMDLGEGAWNSPRLWSLLTATAFDRADVPDYEMDLASPHGGNRQLIIHARRLLYGDGAGVRLLLSISDVTAARAVDREKALLLREVQHRVANSLQVIASILMQSARRLPSEEARSHLRDAHHRIMSVAAVQRQLANTTLGDVHLKDYLTDLCHNLGDSMIRDHRRLIMVVEADDAIATSSASVSLGLVVTELVINALRHGFPEGRSGTIKVTYRLRGGGWTLAVADDGAGRPVDPALQKPGLGAGIIKALAGQLGATVVVTDTAPGTQVTLTAAGPLTTAIAGAGVVV